MQIASILSDLTSLRACEHSAAIALVSVRGSDQTSAALSSQSNLLVESSGSSTVASQRSNVEKDERKNADPDLQRAMDLVDLHYGVKMKHAQGEDRGLLQARRDVDEVLERLQRRGSFEQRET